MMSRHLVFTRLPAAAALLLSASALLAGCTGDDDANEDAGSNVSSGSNDDGSDAGDTPPDDSQPDGLLDADEAHYGRTYAEWMAEWTRWSNAYAPNEDEALDCKNPIADRTGAVCAQNQDPQSPVFFLAGSFGENLKRECTVAAGKALFFPIMNIAGDNAGVAEDMLYSDDEIRDYVETVVDATDAERVWLRVDGVDVENADQGLVRSAPYTVEVPAGDNSYVCNGIDGVEGSFDGYTGGYWALLAPLSAGEHTVEFGLERGPNPLTGETLEITLHYDLTVE